MKQKNIFLIYFLVYFLNGSVLSATLKVKSNQMFGELNDLQASGVNLDEIAKVKDLSGLESMLSSVGNDKNSDKNTVDQVKNEILKETMNGEDMPNNKTMDINESDIDKMIKNKEEKLELNPNAILESLDNKNGQTKKEDETLTGMETCEEIKKYGKQRIYCEEKYLLKYVSQIFNFREKKKL